MKIAMICSSAEAVCGIGDFTRELSLALEALGEEVYITTEIGDMKHIFEIEPDVVLIQHEYSLYSYIDLQRLFIQLRKRGIKNYITLHGWNDAFKDMNKTIESQSGGIIVLNEKFKRRLVERGAPESKINTIPMGIRNFNVKKKNREDSEAKDKIVGMFGFLELYKGFIEGINAVKYLTSNYDYKVTVILIAFTKRFPAEVQYEKQLDRVIAESGLNVIRVGRGSFLPIDKVLSTLSVCDCLLYPYSTDMFTYSSSAALRDGIASRSPVVATDITFFDDVPAIDAKKEEGCILKAPTSSSEDLALAMKRIFEDKQVRERLLQNSEQFIKKYSWENIALQYQKLFK